MKNVIATILQFILFLFVFAAFSLFPPFRMQHVLYSTPAGTRMFVADGLVITFVVYLIILFIEAAMKRLTTTAPATSVAFVVAIVMGFLMKLGFLTQTRF